MSTASRTAVRVLSVSRVISITGGAAAFLALNFTIYQRTGSAAWLAATLVLTFGATGLFSPFTGMLGDRFDRRIVMISSDLAGAVLFGSMALVRSPGLLLALAFLTAVAESPFESASAAAIPNLVEDDDLGWANGMVAIGRNAGILAGPLLGGLLVALIGPGSVFAANAVSFVVSAALVASVRASFGGRSGRGGRSEADGRESEHQGFRAGFRFLVREPVLRTLAGAWMAMVLGLGMTMVADVPLAKLFDTGSWGYGVMISCWGAGSIVGSVTGRRLHARNEAPWFAAGTGLVAVTSVAVGLSPWFAVILVALLAMGFGDAMSLIAQQGILQRRTPDEVRSRVAGAFDSVVHIGLAVSFGVGGAVATAVGPRRVYLLGGLAASLAVWVALPAARRARREATGLPVEEDGRAVEDRAGRRPAVDPAGLLLE
jgi:MFS family permease